MDTFVYFSGSLGLLWQHSATMIDASVMREAFLNNIFFYFHNQFDRLLCYCNALLILLDLFLGILLDNFLVT